MSKKALTVKVKVLAQPKNTQATENQAIQTNNGKGTENITKPGSAQSTSEGTKPTINSRSQGSNATPTEAVVKPTGNEPVKPAGTSSVNREIKVSKIAKEIEAKAVEQHLTEGFSQLAGYSPITIKEQSLLATDLVNSSLEGARSIIRGEVPLPENLKGTSLITAMEEYLVKNPNAEMIMELAKSPLVSGTSEAAQELRLAAERDPYSPLSVIKRLEDNTKAVIEKNAGESISKVEEKRSKINPD